MKKQKFPTDEELAEIRNLLNDGPASRPLGTNASSVDQVKYALCEQFIIYKHHKKITQRELAREIEIDEALASKILHYHFDEFTIDRLIRYLEILHKKVTVQHDLNEINIRVAS